MFQDAEINKLAVSVFNTDEGMLLLKHLEDIYFTKTALDNDVHKTMYNLGQKELIAELLSLVADKDYYRSLSIQSDPE